MQYHYQPIRSADFEELRQHVEQITNVHQAYTDLIMGIAVLVERARTRELRSILVAELTTNAEKLYTAIHANTRRADASDYGAD